VTPTPAGWYDAARYRELTSIAGLISSPRAYRASPDVINWSPSLPGDCTELTAWAQELLQELGWPAEAMERWTCRTEKGRAHAVLIVHMTLASGVAAVVLDLRHVTPMRKVDLAYTKWTKIEGPPARC